jgi:dihydroxyacetone kinase-like protein
MGDGAVSIEQLRGWLAEFARLVVENKDYLTQLDAAIGDADHGINMDRGMKAVVGEVTAAEFADVSSLFKRVGMTLVTTVGGASGPLYGTFFLRFGMSGGNVESLTPAAFSAAVRAGLDGVVTRGKPELGDKTMLDAMAPAADALDAAAAGRDATTPMLARKGRASYLGERSVGHQDPGATSTALLFEAAATTLSVQ